MDNLPKCCISCERWFSNGLMFGICTNTVISREICRCAGDGKDCQAYQVITSQEEWERRLKEYNE